MVFKRRVYTGIRIVDELDTYPGRPFLYRYLKRQSPALIEPTNICKITVPSRRMAIHELIKMNQELANRRHGESNLRALKRRIENYVDVYCFPQLDLKIPLFRYRKNNEQEKV